MKVLQINSWFTCGGPPRIVNGIYDTLTEHGHECKIASARAEMYKPEDSIMIGKKYAPYINALSCRIFDDDGFRSKLATRKLIEDIKSYDPDIIHLHNLHSYYLNIEILFDYLKVCGKQIYWTLHDCWAFTGHCAYFSMLNCEKWKELCHDCPQKTSFPTCYIHSNAKKNFERKKKAFTGVPNMTIVTPSKWLSDHVKNSFLSEYPIKIIYNKIDTDTFKPTTSNIKEKLGIKNKILLGVAIVWNERKGLSDIIKLSERLDNDYSIVVVGLNDKQIKELPNGIIGIKKTENVEELVKLYSAADVFLNPSREETFGLTTIEALACGTPAIVYKGTACEEILSDFGSGSCGAAVEAGDIDGILKEIKSLSKNSDACINRARFFDRHENCDEFLKLYEGNII